MRVREMRPVGLAQITFGSDHHGGGRGGELSLSFRTNRLLPVLYACAAAVPVVCLSFRTPLGGSGVILTQLAIIRRHIDGEGRRRAGAQCSVSTPNAVLERRAHLIITHCALLCAGQTRVDDKIFIRVGALAIRQPFRPSIFLRLPSPRFRCRTLHADYTTPHAYH